ncbi:hypothetical protein [Cyanobacterium sp. Dongsha4]|uniref:hypothetical protein n=1 Tax=Cyanobacterium sp. DS4 TaxID=2878255 RepID=UPI002E808E23|nr:hypothetical protein [Cyanobacterium sp. Dongsha4]WVL00128.1 hypothetical protein Dongsha4_15950 [Cyanobacterium sp. Dongsha4]
MIPFITNLLEKYNPYLQPFYLLIAWGLFFVLIWTLITAIIDINKRSQKMHQIPCTNCQYFTSNFYLKCPVNPSTANTELAINCRDFQKKQDY